MTHPTFAIPRARLVIAPSLCAAALLLAVACSGDKSTTTPTQPTQPTQPPPPAQPARVASVTVSTQGGPSLMVGGTRMVDAVTRDSAGSVLTGRTIVFASGDARVATVSSAGLVTAIAPGSTPITATSEGVTGTMVFVVVAAPIPVTGFRAPFTTPVPTVNFFDHDVPFQFNPQYDNGRFITFWGEAVNGIDGHNGYDYLNPEGTPLLAVAPGVVTFAGLETPFSCPLLNRTVSGLWITVRHTLPDGEVLFSQFGHFSRIDVTAGQTVTAGQQLGLSGNTGCSSTPHLHFAVYRLVGNRSVVTDPYGWTATSPDPWAAHSLGAPSRDVWVENAAAGLYRQITPTALNAGPNDRSPVGIAAIVYMGADDVRSPNNEYIELVSDARFAGNEHSLTGYRLRNNAGATYAFPAGASITAGQRVRVYSGVGTNTASTFYWGRSTPAWGNLGDCVRVVYPGNALWTWWYGNSGGCPTLPSALTAPVVHSGFTPPAVKAIDWSPAERRRTPY